MKFKKFIVFCCLLILFIFVFGFTSNLQTRAMSYNDNIIYTKYSFDVELTLDTGDIVEFSVSDKFDINSLGYQIRTDYNSGYVNLVFDTVVVDNYLKFNLSEGRFNVPGKSYYFYNTDVVSYKLVFDDIIIVWNGFNNFSDLSLNELQIETFQYDVTYTADYWLYNFRDNPDEGLEIQRFTVEGERGSVLTGLPIFLATKYSALYNTYGFIPVSHLVVDVLNDENYIYREFSLMLPIIEPNFTYDLYTYENVYDTLSFFVNRSVYGFFPLDSNVNFTSWISTAVSGFLTPEILPGVSIGGILIVCIAIPLLLAFLKFFAGG